MDCWFSRSREHTAKTSKSWNRSHFSFFLSIDDFGWHVAKHSFELIELGCGYFGSKEMSFLDIKWEMGANGRVNGRFRFRILRLHCGLQAKFGEDAFDSMWVSVFEVCTWNEDILFFFGFGVWLWIEDDMRFSASGVYTWGKDSLWWFDIGVDTFIRGVSLWSECELSSWIEEELWGCRGIEDVLAFARISTGGFPPRGPPRPVDRNRLTSTPDWRNTGCHNRFRAFVNQFDNCFMSIPVSLTSFSFSSSFGYGWMKCSGENIHAFKIFLACALRVPRRVPFFLNEESSEWSAEGFKAECFGGVITLTSGDVRGHDLGSDCEAEWGVSQKDGVIVYTVYFSSGACGSIQWVGALSAVKKSGASVCVRTLFKRLTRFGDDVMEGAIESMRFEYLAGALDMCLQPVLFNSLVNAGLKVRRGEEEARWKFVTRFDVECSEKCFNPFPLSKSLGVGPSYQFKNQIWKALNSLVSRCHHCYFQVSVIWLLRWRWWGFKVLPFEGSTLQLDMQITHLVLIGFRYQNSNLIRRYMIRQSK